MLLQIKRFLREQLGLPPIAVLVIVGLGSHLLLNAVLRKPATSAWGLLAPLTLGVCLESFEVWAQYRDIGFMTQGIVNVSGIVIRHSFDVLKLMLVPMALVAFGTFVTR